jgi:hypothetical protein
MCNTYEIHSCALDDKKGKMSKTSFYEIFISFIVLCQKILAVIVCQFKKKKNVIRTL